MTNARASYFVIAMSALFEGSSFLFALHTVRRKYPGQPLWRAFRATKDPSDFMVVFEDGAALIGLTFAVVGIALGQRCKSTVPDACASICIGVLLALIATVLARESKELLIGEVARPEVLAPLRALIEENATLPV